MPTLEKTNPLRVGIEFRENYIKFFAISRIFFESLGFHLGIAIFILKDLFNLNKGLSL
jgi:hypothetical protein